MIENDDLTIPLLSNFDDRKNALFKFDYEEQPKEFGFIKSATAIPPNSQDFYDLRNKFTDVKGIIIQLRGNNKCLSLYKNKTNLTVFEQSRKLFNLIPDSDGYLKELPNQVFRLDYNYDLALLENDFLIKNQKTLEVTMQFHQVIEAQATVALESLRSSSLIDDLSHLEKSAKEISFSRKLAKISKHSPVLGKIDVPVIIHYVSHHTYLSTVLIVS
ncbi:Kiwa anti-phage protein KwaB-like domain-containing protein, partial [Klebsiella pneumoniae]